MGFGEQPTTINFNTTLNLIAGANGMGKTSVLEALTFCLYGKPYRKVKIADIINWKNKGNLQTSCTFIVNDKDEFKIIRNLSPDTFKIFKNGKELDLLSHKKLNQEEIDKIIGVSYTVFKSTISLAISYNEPFLALDAKGKRSFVEQSFSISVFGKMLELVKKRVSETKKNKEMADFAVDTLERTISSLEESYEDMEKAKEEFEEEKKNKIDTLKKEISTRTETIKSYETELLTTKVKIEKNKKKIAGIDKNALTIKEKAIEKKISVLEFSKKDYDRKLKFTKDNEKCPTCGNRIDPESRRQETLTLEYQVKNTQEELNKYSKALTIIVEDCGKINDIEADIYEDGNEEKRLTTEIKSINREIQFYTQELTSAQEEKNEINLDEFKKSIEDKKKELDTKKKLCSTYNNDMTVLKTSSQVLSEDGVRTYVIDKILPLLNKKINEYLDIFELPLKITFNKQMEEKIISLKNFRKEINYYSCSEGEKKRIDFAMLLSFIETMKIVSNWNSNLLMIDELLDSSIDETGLEKMLQTLFKLSSEKKIGIYVISHRISNDLKSYFSYILKLTKDKNDFSKIEM